MRDVSAADTIIDMAWRVAARRPGSSRMTPAGGDVLLVEAEATLAQVHGFRLVPCLVQTEGYFREIAPDVFGG